MGPARRIAYSFIALLAGEAAMLVYFLQNDLRIAILYRDQHPGLLTQQLSQSAQIFVLYGVFAFVGWILIGIPAVLMLPANRIARWPWLVCVVMGAGLGPLALILILFILAGGRFRLENSGALWPFAILVSSVSFVVYSALVRRRTSPRNPQPAE